MKLTEITENALRRRGACSSQIDKFAQMFPESMPLTQGNVWKCHEAGLDVIWGACHLLMNKGQRKEFIYFTLRQRQPHIVKLLIGAGLKGHTERVAELDFADLEEAENVLDAAERAMWAMQAASGAERAARADAEDAVRNAKRDARAAAEWTVRDAAWNAWDAAGAAKRVAGDAEVKEQIRWCIKECPIPD